MVKIECSKKLFSSLKVNEFLKKPNWRALSILVRAQSVVRSSLRTVGQIYANSSLRTSKIRKSMHFEVGMAPFVFKFEKNHVFGHSIFHRA